jgi:deoxyribodipyrimidine photolyase-related protein
MATRWLFGDQLGPHFLPGVHGSPDQGAPDDQDSRALLIESRAAFRRRRYHRQKAHIVLSAMRHRAAELGEACRYVPAETYREALAHVAGPISVVDPTSWGARDLVRRLAQERELVILPSRGFVTTEAEFAAWASGRRQLRLEDFYRDVRRRTGILMDGAEPVGGRWNFDADNRLPPPRNAISLGLPAPTWPAEDDIDAGVREDLDRWQRDGVEFIGVDGPRSFAVTRQEALAVLEDFVAHRLKDFGPYEDAALVGDWAMAHSLLSVPLNLGLLDPREVVDRVVLAWAAGDVPLASAEGFVRQVVGWRDFVWHLYWHFGPSYVESSNAMGAHEPLPEWFRDLRADDVRARCISTALGEVRDRGWNHHIIRLMVLGNWALQRGYEPRAVTEWFTASYVDAYPWVMAANVVGMALHADGGRMATKPYAAGGAYIKRMTDFCVGCAYRPDRRVGEQGCPITAGYWAFIARHEEAFARHPRMAQPARGLTRLADRDALLAQEAQRGSDPP